MKTKTLVIILSISMAIIFVGEGTLIYFLLSNSRQELKPEGAVLGSNQELQAQEVISKMIESMEKVKTFHYVTIRIYKDETINDSETTNTKAEFDVDISDQDNIKDSGLISYSVIAPPSFGSLSMEMDYEIISLNKKTFIKIVKAPEGYDTQHIGQWIVSDDEYPSEGVGGMPTIINLFKNNILYTIEEGLPDEKINGKEVYHYMLSLRDDIDFMTVAEYRNFSLMQGEEVDVYIGKEDNLLYRFSFSGEGETYNTLFNIEFSDYNKPVDIKEPADYISP